MNTLVHEAILNRQLLSFTYDGFFRVVEAHCYGESTKGNEVFRAYQVDGESSTGKMGWKLYDLSKVRNLLLLEQAFPNVREGYKKGDKGMSNIIIEL
jgi:hypothetical protein